MTIFCFQHSQDYLAGLVAANEEKMKAEKQVEVCLLLPKLFSVVYKAVLIACIYLHKNYLCMGKNC